MFNKFTTFEIAQDGFELLDSELIKTASIKLPDGTEYDPDFFYIKVRAVSAGEYWGYNKNADYFPEAELKKSYKTFLNAHTFKNHENKDIANAIGDVLTAEWNDKMKGVDLLIRIDRRIAPTIVRGFEKGFMTDVSMGCRIEYSICSVCGNKAKTKFDYCDHIKYQRGRILSDGKKVGEINIGPKFHDISAVLNGAERAAKVTGMLIVGNKVAFTVPQDMEKVASVQDSIENDPELVENMNFNPESILPESMEILAEYKHMTKRDYIQKVAEIKKQIQGKIVTLAEGEVLEERMKKADNVFKVLKLLYEKYWDKDKCSEIADQINLIAKKNDIPPEVAFNQFLKVLDFAGMELSPLEFNDIFYHLIGKDYPDFRASATPFNEEYGGNFMDNVSRRIDSSTISDIDLPSLLSTITKNVIPNSSLIADKLSGDNPANKLKAIIIKVKRSIPDNGDKIENDIMNSVVSPLMPERSFHKKFIIKKLASIANDEIEPNFDNIYHFIPVTILENQKLIKTASIPVALSAIAYSKYQEDRINRFNNGELDYGFTKFASYIHGDSMDNIFNEFIVEKTARINDLSKIKSKSGFKGYTTGKAIMYGVPATYGYSALQRARIENGENVNGFNRFIADNPGSAAVGQAIAGPAINKGVKKMVGGAGKFLKSLAKNPPKVASEMVEYVFTKTADINSDSEFYNKDMFKDNQIDSKMSDAGYNKEQVSAIKYANVMIYMDRQDVADNILAMNKVAMDDVSQYLQICKDCIKIEIEKNAGVARNTALNVAGDVLFNPFGTSTLATLPGNIVDGAVFAKLSEKVNKNSQTQQTVKPRKNEQSI